MLSVVALLALIASAGAQPGGPEFVIDGTRRDFGDVFAGEELVQVFGIRNAGRKPLELAEKSVTTGSIFPAPRDLIKTGSFNRGELSDDHFLPVAVAARRAAPS
jgi:hypothetical protein